MFLASPFDDSRDLILQPFYKKPTQMQMRNAIGIAP
jgi:hypothetical protein